MHDELNTVGKMSRGDALLLSKILFDGQVIHIFRYDLYNLLEKEYTARGGWPSNYTKKQIGNFMSDLVKLYNNDCSIIFKSTGHSYDKERGALYEIDFRSVAQNCNIPQKEEHHYNVASNENTSPTYISKEPRMIPHKPNTLCIHNKVTYTSNIRFYENSEDVLCFSSPESANQLVYFFSYDSLISHLNSDDRYPIIIGISDSMSVIDSISNMLGSACPEWPRVLLMIRCNDSELLASSIKAKLSKMKVDAPSDCCYLSNRDELLTLCTALFSSIVSKYGF